MVVRDPTEYLVSEDAPAKKAFRPDANLLPGALYVVRRSFRAERSSIPIPKNTWLELVEVPDAGSDSFVFTLEGDRVVLEVSDPRLRETLSRLEEFLAPYDPERDTLPFERDHVVVPSERVDSPTLLEFAAEAAQQLQPRFRTPDLSKTTAGGGYGEHGEEDYDEDRKRYRYGSVNRSHIERRHGWEEAPKGCGRFDVVVEARFGTSWILTIGWPGSFSEPRLHLSMQGRGAAVKRLRKVFRDRFERPVDEADEADRRA